MSMLDEQPKAPVGARALVKFGTLAAYAVLIATFWYAMTVIRTRRLGLPAEIFASAAYVILVGATVYASRRAWRRVSGAVVTTALLRRGRRTLVCALIYGVLLLAATWLHVIFKLQGVVAYALAVLPALPVVGMAVAVGLYFREETDEFERAVRVESALWATGVTLAAATVWGFAELLADAPHIQAWLWFPIWALFSGIADSFTRRRYQ